MKLLINVRACEMIPQGYGFAYHGSYSDTSYYAPIPLNFVIGAWHNFYWYCLVRGWFNQSPLIGVQNWWRGKGFSEGEAYGYEKGVRDTVIAYKADPRIATSADQSRPVADADRSGGRVSRAADRVIWDDPVSTGRRVEADPSCAAPCATTGIEGEVPERMQAGRSELLLGPLDHCSGTDAVAIPDRTPEGSLPFHDPQLGDGFLTLDTTNILPRQGYGDRRDLDRRDDCCGGAGEGLD